MSEASNESLYIALGLKPDADRETAILVAGENQQAVRQILTITKSATVADALGIVMANAAAAERYQAAEAKLHAIEKTQREKDFDALVLAGDLSGQLTPALAKSDWIKGLRTDPNGVVTLKSYLERAPVVVSRKPVVEDDSELDNVELSEKEIEVAKKMVGDDQVALKSRLDALRTSKLEDIRSRKAARR
jgi:hypothetical protein